VHWPINLEEEGVLVVVVDAEEVSEDVGAVEVRTEVDAEVIVEDVVDEEDHVQDVKRRRRNGSQLPSWDVWLKRVTSKQSKMSTSFHFLLRSTRSLIRSSATDLRMKS
jgi:hypothetical protein